MGGKGGRCVRLTTLPPSCAVVMKSVNLNFLEPSAPLQACNGTDLLYLYIYIYIYVCVCVYTHTPKFNLKMALKIQNV